jgi:hypothetical protein
MHLKSVEIMTWEWFSCVFEKKIQPQSGEARKPLLANHTLYRKFYQTKNAGHTQQLVYESKKFLSDQSLAFYIIFLFHSL